MGCGADKDDVFAAAFGTYRWSLTLPATDQRPTASPDELRTAVDEFFPEDRRYNAKEIEVLQADGGRYLGYVRMLGCRQG